MANDTISTSWFAVFNNPADHDYKGTPQEVCERLRDEWIKDSQTRSGAWAYCVSSEGLHHVHMVLEDLKPMRFSKVKKEYCIGMHFEATKGNKKQADDYINKRPPFDEKDEEVLFICYHGDIRGKQGRRSDLQDYYDRMSAGETPDDILNTSPKAFAHVNVLKNMFYHIKNNTTPLVRDIKVYWHIGRSGSGKSYERVLRANELGTDEDIYYLTAFHSGSFDNYNGQSILWIEDYRGEFKLQELLRILDKYKAEVPARYCNAKALWNEVHITSVLTPRECYSKSMLDDNDRIEQLLRRITSICYHFKTADGQYCKLYFDPNCLRVQMENEVNKYKSFLSEWVLIDTTREEEGAGDSPLGVTAPEAKEYNQ